MRYPLEKLATRATTRVPTPHHIAPAPTETSQLSHIWVSDRLQVGEKIQHNLVEFGGLFQVWEVGGAWDGDFLGVGDLGWQEVTDFYDVGFV